ncbi:thymidine phosphorylase [Sediminibacterium sp.]|uniref:thymidine phosphorylase n=1 Tax=Sediminibacterium sp. TaxID=1917865 RepID=UPI0027312129|nr:thymidine phosphorylase [Sediminibacterium sp.]MDP2421360.1 thymidine phosphorylase [Sediminibacterium sp.]
MKVLTEQINHTLLFKDLGIDTNQEFVVFMPSSCHICKSEGFQALTRLSVSLNRSTIVATLNIISSDLLKEGEISLSKSAMQKLKVKDTDLLRVSPVDALNSMAHVKEKLNGNPLNGCQYNEIIMDIATRKYSNIFLSSFVAACSGDNVNMEEIYFLTQAMIKVGNKLQWENEIIADNECISGLHGNRISIIVVSIIASLGITIPKISSKAITSPAGIANTMQVLTNVNLSLAQMYKVVEKENGCIAWGGAMKLCPADNNILKVKRALGVDSEGLMIASILAKKAAAGITHCVIDIPIVSAAKVQTIRDSISLALRLKEVADYIGLNVEPICFNEVQPLGFGIGPSLEARDVLSVLQNNPDAPKDLRKRAISIATEIVRLTWNIDNQPAEDLVVKKIDSGEAFSKLISICIAQGGFHEPVQAKYNKTILSAGTGIISEIDHQIMARIARLAGAPDDVEAGIDLKIQLRECIDKCQPLFTIHANSPEQLNYAYEYYKQIENKTIKLNYE